jgi:hypothetical protein
MNKKDSISNPTTVPVTPEGGKFIQRPVNINLGDLVDIKTKSAALLQQLLEYHYTDLSTLERLRKQGAGTKRYGFIDRTSDIALENEEFAPRMYDAQELKDLLRSIEQARDILSDVAQVSRSISDMLLILGDEAYQMALVYYNSLRELSRARVAGAEALYRILLPYFKKTRSNGEEPTEPELERDVKALLHGAKDGKIVIENENPHTTGGKHVVVDETHKDRGAWKETETGKMG